MLFYIKFFLISFIYMLVATLSSCGDKESLGDIAANMYTSNYAKSIEQSDNNSSKDNSEASTSRGILSWLSSNNKKSPPKEDVPDHSQSPKIIDNSIHEEEDIAEVSNDEKLNSILESKDKASKFQFNFFNNVWKKFQVFRSGNTIIEQRADYKEDTFITNKCLNLVVLKIPQGDQLKLKTNDLNQFSKENNENLEEVNIINNVSKANKFSDLHIISENNKELIINKPTDSITLRNNTNTNKQMYEDYVSHVKNSSLGNRHNKDSFYTPISYVISLHKDLINQLLFINTATPNVLYVAYRDINNINDKSSLKNQLFLSSYLNKIRAFIYEKMLSNIFIQEVKLPDLPVDQILLVLKPITKEQFDVLPKQTNLYNAPKVSSKEWLNHVTAINEEAKQKQKLLYRQASGLSND